MLLVPMLSRSVRTEPRCAPGADVSALAWEELGVILHLCGQGRGGQDLGRGWAGKGAGLLLQEAGFATGSR